MLLLEEAIEKVVVSEGQQLIPLEAFSLDMLTIQNLFKYSLREYQEYFPNVKTKKLYGTSGIAVSIPDCIGSPMSFRFGGYPQVVGMNPRFEKPNWQWDYQTKTLTSVVGGGPWIVTYASNYTLENCEINDTYQTIDSEDQVSFKLRGAFKGKSLTITRQKDKLYMNTVDVFEKEGFTIAELEGPLGTGRCTINDLTCELEIDAPRNDILDIHYTSKYLGVKELTFQNQEFLIWFGSKLLTSIGSLKLMTQLEGMPFNISIDDLRSRGIELQNQVETDLKISKQEFFMWTGNKY